MTISTAEQRLEQVFDRHGLGGLWAELAQAADAPTIGAGDVWRGIERRLLTNRAPAATGMWAALAQQIDPAQYCPHAVPDVAEELVTEGDQTFSE